ncbi:hypothetical protein BESB_034210 [Besnoitia besnoiti]|uniref:SRS domain-containing protein n=1 Tax=Besnoitia besnoiti TaxID=94643 RepID=A0A2A9MME5_BESBE|nr:hypothetical protein BESB_034210 [Besnoitia besnoiti]PFH36963.1 hypothetical protein BESB_034210 [Besnoitia besnoiti]
MINSLISQRAGIDSSTNVPMRNSYIALFKARISLVLGSLNDLVGPCFPRSKASNLIVPSPIMVAQTKHVNLFFIPRAGAPRASLAGDEAGAQEADQTAGETCDPTQIKDKQWLDLVLKPEMTNISFGCKEDLKALKPEGDKVFTTEECKEDHQTPLSTACAGAKLERSVAGATKHTLTVNPRPPQDKVFYYKCQSADSPSMEALGFKVDAQKTECIIKITVKGVGPATVVPAAHICVPKETGKDSRNVKELTLEGDKQSIDFSCGKQANTQLTPAANLNKFCADEGCQDQKDLSTVWSDAALTESTAGDATSYTLSVKSERSEDKSIYYKCSIPANEKTEVHDDEGARQEKACVLKITVKSGDTSSAAAWMTLTSCLIGQVVLGLLNL